MCHELGMMIVNYQLVLIHFLHFASADAIERAWQILDQIPGRATGAYSHSQVVVLLWESG